MTKNNTILSAFIFLILAQIMTATNIVGSKYLVASIPILFLLTMRFSLAFFLLLPLHWVSNARKNSVKYYLAQLNKKDWFFIIAQAVCAGVLFNCLMLAGLHYTDANIAGIITSTLPAMIVIMSWIFLREKISGKKTICILFATLGLLIISIDKLHTTNGVYPSLIGGMLVLLSLIPEATYYVLSKIHPNRLTVFLISAIINGINAIILLPFLFIFMNWHTLQLTSFDWLILIIVSMTSGLFYTFWYLGSHKVDMTLASVSTALMPIMTVIIAWLALGEKINLVELAGMSLVIISIIIYALR